MQTETLSRLHYIQIEIYSLYCVLEWGSGLRFGCWGPLHVWSGIVKCIGKMTLFIAAVMHVTTQTHLFNIECSYNWIKKTLGSCY